MSLSLQKTQIAREFS